MILVPSVSLSSHYLKQPDKHYTFEPPSSSSASNNDTGSATSASAQEWLDIIDRSRDIAFSQSLSTNINPNYTDNDTLSDLQSGKPTSARALDLDSPGPSMGDGGGGGRHKLEKQAPGGLTADRAEVEEERGGFMGVGRKRFSKRQSKSGLAAVF